MNNVVVFLTCEKNVRFATRKYCDDDDDEDQHDHHLRYDDDDDDEYDVLSFSCFR